MAEERNFRKVRRGYVVSDKMDKTISVELEQRSTHPLYGKVVRSTRTVKVHDEHNEAHIGDLVSIMETRPLSKTKRWRLDSIIERAMLISSARLRESPRLLGGARRGGQSQWPRQPAGQHLHPQRQWFAGGSNLPPQT